MTLERDQQTVLGEILSVKAAEITRLREQVAGLNGSVIRLRESKAATIKDAIQLRGKLDRLADALRRLLGFAGEANDGLGDNEEAIAICRLARAALSSLEKS